MKGGGSSAGAHSARVRTRVLLLVRAVRAERALPEGLREGWLRCVPPRKPIPPRVDIRDPLSHRERGVAAVCDNADAA